MRHIFPHRLEAAASRDLIERTVLPHYLALYPGAKIALDWSTRTHAVLTFHAGAPYEAKVELQDRMLVVEMEIGFLKQAVFLPLIQKELRRWLP